MIEVIIFAAKVGIVVLGFAIIIILIAIVAARAGAKPELEVDPVHRHLKQLGFLLKSMTLTKEEQKQEKKKRKEEKKSEEKKATSGKKIFLLEFTGDIKAHQVENLREEITAILQLATQQDEVVAKVESPGGLVHGYGLAASQFLRLKEKQVPLTVCIDKVAASGGYLMSCVANQILAAPFAIVGSIGVVAQVPNFNRFLKKYDVDYKEYTAGEFKRTVSVFGEITPKGEEKFVNQLEDTHKLFKEFVGKNRPQINLTEVATGEYWYGERAKNLGLIDKLQTSDDYLLEAFKANTPIYKIKYKKKHNFSEKISEIMSTSVASGLNKVIEKFLNGPLT